MQLQIVRAPTFFCDHCKVYNSSRIRPIGKDVKGGYKSEWEEEREREQEPSGQQIIAQRLRAL
jgi:hypothetical protein